MIFTNLYINGVSENLPLLFIICAMIYTSNRRASEKHLNDYVMVPFIDDLNV